MTSRQPAASRAASAATPWSELRAVALDVLAAFARTA
jgi:hypothetical protein